MTDREKAIIMAHTGICMLEGEKIGVFYKYLNELYGRPVYTHEWMTLDIKEKSKPDFLQLCKEEEPEQKKGKWIMDGCVEKCNLCGEPRRFPHWIACPGCGARMDNMTENFIRIKLEKRTFEEKRAWHEGYNSGLADGKRNENTTLIFKTKCRMGVEQYRATIRDLERQADRGIILLHPEIEFAQAVGNNPEVRLEYDDEPEE